MNSNFESGQALTVEGAAKKVIGDAARTWERDCGSSVGAQYPQYEAEREGSSPTRSMVVLKDLRVVLQ
jgi:hypothetical protein